MNSWKRKGVLGVKRMGCWKNVKWKSKGSLKLRSKMEQIKERRNNNVTKLLSEGLFVLNEFGVRNTF